MSDKEIDVINCFEYKCPMKWTKLKKTNNEDQRYCGACDKVVFKAETVEEAEKLSLESKCVALAIKKAVDEREWDLNDIPVGYIRAPKKDEKNEESE